MKKAALSPIFLLGALCLSIASGAYGSGCSLCGSACPAGCWEALTEAVNCAVDDDDISCDAYEDYKVGFKLWAKLPQIEECKEDWAKWQKEPLKRRKQIANVLGLAFRKYRLHRGNPSAHPTPKKGFLHWAKLHNAANYCHHCGRPDTRHCLKNKCTTFCTGLGEAKLKQLARKRLEYRLWKKQQRARWQQNRKKKRQRGKEQKAKIDKALKRANSKKNKAHGCRMTMAGNPSRLKNHPAQCSDVNTKLAVRCCGRTTPRIQMGRYGCNDRRTFEEATEICKVFGFRLCSRKEIEGGVTSGTGCGYDAKRIWTSSKPSKNAKMPGSKKGKRPGSKKGKRTGSRKGKRTGSRKGKRNKAYKNGYKNGYKAGYKMGYSNGSKKNLKQNTTEVLVQQDKSQQPKVDRSQKEKTSWQQLGIDVLSDLSARYGGQWSCW
jgi:hypothetical protein